MRFYLGICCDKFLQKFSVVVRSEWCISWSFRHVEESSSIKLHGASLLIGQYKGTNKIQQFWIERRHSIWNMPPYKGILGVLPLLGTRKKAFNWEHATIQRDIGSFAIVGD